MKKVGSFAKTLAENGNIDEAVNNFRDLKIADHLVPEAINTLFTHLINKTGKLAVCSILVWASS